MTFVIIYMMTARVGRGGFFVLLEIEAGQTSIGLGSTSNKSVHDSVIPCSIVGLFNVLSGTDYVAVGGDRQCIVRLHDSHVEVVWKRGSTDTVVRLTKPEYRHLLSTANESTHRSAA